jgi:RND family efflux transporter MFP subunit
VQSRQNSIQYEISDIDDPEEMMLRPAAYSISDSKPAGPARHRDADRCKRRLIIPSRAPRRAGAARYTSALGCLGFLALAACERNQLVVPPPPTVTVELPIQQTVTPHLEATGNTASINSVNLIARVQGYLQEIKYQDGTFVKKGTPLFVIEPQPYQVKLEQAQAAEEGAKAAFVNAEAQFNRQQDLRVKDVNSQANLDQARATRDSDQANVLQAQANRESAQINFGYTTVSAPFDGIVTARKVSVGELVGGDQPNQLASIVQLKPLWVWFNLSERDVQQVKERAGAAMTVDTVAERKIPVEVGLQTENGYPHKGVIDYASPTVDQSTGTLQVRGVFENAEGTLLPGYFVRVRLPQRQIPGLLVPEVAIGSDQAGRYVLAVNADNIVEQRRVQLGQNFGELRLIESGLNPDERIVVAGILDAVPGQKVNPQAASSKSAATEGTPK